MNQKLQSIANWISQDSFVHLPVDLCSVIIQNHVFIYKASKYILSHYDESM